MSPDKRVARQRPAGVSMGNYTLSESEFETIRRLVKEKTGISLGLHKRDLVVSRLAKRLRTLGLGSFAEYIQVLEADSEGQELVHMINRITTNKTDFFREKHHFDYLADTLFPQLLKAGEKSGQRIVRIWSAACSSGEEPYTIAMTAAEFFKSHSGWQVKILASDLDTTMLSKASKGVYEEELVEPIPGPYLKRYFDRLVRGNEIFYRVKPELRRMITFRKFNLMNPRYPFKVKLDIIFCRNVLIYFDPDDKAAILTKMHGVLAEDGHIFVGHSESLMMVKHLFKYVGNTIYRKV